jgi:hypothetical protein
MIRVGKHALIDTGLVLATTAAGILLLPFISALFVRLSLSLDMFVYLHPITGDFLPHVVTGVTVGVVGALISQTKKIVVPTIPGLLVCVFYALYGTFGPIPYPWNGTYYDAVLVGSWISLVLSCLWISMVLLRKFRNESRTSFGPR